MVGKVDYVNPAYAYIIVEEREQDILVRQKDLLSALDGDVVKVLILKKEENIKQHVVGKVTEILEKSKKKWVGTVQQQGDLLLLYPPAGGCIMIYL